MKGKKEDIYTSPRKLSVENPFASGRLSSVEDTSTYGSGGLEISTGDYVFSHRDPLICRSPLIKSFTEILPRLLTHDVLPWRKATIFLATLASRRRSQGLVESFLESSDTKQGDMLPTARPGISDAIYDPNSQQLPILPDYSERKKIINYFYDGVEAVSTSLWQPAFLGMFLYDLKNYFHLSNNRYQIDTMNLILGGSRHNYNYHYSSLSSALGSDIPAWLSFWPWIFLPAGALIAGVLNALILSCSSDCDLDPERFKSIFEKFQFTLQHNFPYLGRYSKKLSRLKADLMLTADVNLTRAINEIALVDEDEIESMLYTKEYHWLFAKWSAIKMLTIIYYHPHYRSRSKDNLQQVIQEITSFQYFLCNPLASLYAHYNIWSAGHSKNIITHLLNYLIIFPIQLFSQARWWSLIVNKIWQLYQFYSNKSKCDTDQKVWRFVAEQGNYECTACDWDFVDYRNSLTEQGCLDLLLATPRTSQDIIEKLKEIGKHGPYDVIDFSAQPWTQWSDSDWKDIMSYLGSNNLFNHALVLNLSRAMFIPQAVSPYLIVSVANLINNSEIEILDLSRQYLSQQCMESLLPGLQNNQRIRNVIFNNSLLADTTASLFLRVIPTMPNLTAISMRGCELTGYNMSLINGALTNSSEIKSIDLSDNPIASVHIEELAGNLSYSQVTEIYLDGIDLTDMNVTRFGAGLISSSVTRLFLNNCQITDRIASRLFPFIANALVEFLQWSNNQIGYNSLISIAPLLAGSKISHFILDNNYIDDDALMLLSPAVGASNNSLTELSLSGNPFTATGFSKFIPAITNSSLTTLNVARTPIGDQGVRALISIMGNTSLLRTIDLNTVRMTSTGASDLFYGIARTQATSLDVSHNQVGAAAGDPLLAALNGTALVSINLADTQLIPDLLQQTLAVLPYSNLQIIDVSYNPLGDVFVLNLSNIMVAPVPNREEWLSRKNDDYDFNRALARISPQIALRKFALNYGQITEVGARALCLSIGSSNVSMDDLFLSGNPINSSKVSVRGCPSVSSVLATQGSSIMLRTTTVVDGNVLSINAVGSALLVSLMITSFTSRVGLSSRLTNLLAVLAGMLVFAWFARQGSVLESGEWLPAAVIGSLVSTKLATTLSSVVQKFSFFQSKPDFEIKGPVSLDSTPPSDHGSKLSNSYTLGS